MKSKKVVKDWKLAIIFYIKYLLILVVLGIIISMVGYPIILSLQSQPGYNPVVSDIINSLLTIGLTTVTIILAAALVKKRYTIKHAEKVAGIAVGIDITLIMLVDLALSPFYPYYSRHPHFYNDPLTLTTTVLEVLLFYFLTKYFLGKK